MIYEESNLQSLSYAITVLVLFLHKCKKMKAQNLIHQDLITCKNQYIKESIVESYQYRMRAKLTDPCGGKGSVVKVQTDNRSLSPLTQKYATTSSGIPGLNTL